ncbi:MAG: hypothetical protein H6891_03690 [Brucellaceae bacterium]|nr:hypothetical protein [Brucellaceae bacterium]
MLAAIPFMRAAADTRRQVFGEPAPGSDTAARLYEKQPRLNVAMSDWLEARRGRFENNGRPCYLARCVSAAEPDANGMRSLFYIQTSHAIAEGLDVSALVRGRAKATGPGGPTRRTTGLASRLLHDALAVVAAPAVLLAANLLPVRKASEGFQLVSFDRAAIRAVAGRLGIGQKALCIALVAAGLTPRQLFHRLAYITLPSTGGPGEFDGHIAFHIRQTAVRAGGDFAAFARRVDTACAPVLPDITSASVPYDSRPAFCPFRCFPSTSAVDEPRLPGPRHDRRPFCDAGGLRLRAPRDPLPLRPRPPRRTWWRARHLASSGVTARRFTGFQSQNLATSQSFLAAYASKPINA